MKTLVEKWTPSNEQSFIVKEYSITREYGEESEVLMRRHDEYEITVIIGGSGKRIVGNVIENFSEGDIFMLGPLVPHSVQVDEGQKVEGLTVHFLDSAFGKGFFDLPENRQILQLLKDSHFGVTYKGVAYRSIVEKLKKMIALNSFDRMIELFQLLSSISKLKNRQLISSQGFTKITKNKDYVLVNKTFDYIMTRFEKEPIPLEDISKHVNMSPSTFCRFFKKHFQMTYTHFMNEVRIGHACKLLQDTNKNIAQIAYSSGYNHLTHFNKQFKRIMGYSPKEYRREIN
ncbi:AraC-like DNA-binding protein [Jejuia pallidilutea]|uniref:AraC-like DNA-binding protein n=1 Tax=Jejuia pallidilutea TaxID=504487 RepID=A0A362XGQ6_9FLAO|nr:AraC family transcriptional regulator [Jejuia pallidilutea]PQV51492.1 AraC-like DNA-binding protein [Jejuia pallidilutea]